MNNYIDMFRNSEMARQLGETLKNYRGRPVTIMEVCGTHTMAIFRYGIRSLLPENIRLISGPGCPVCVTPAFYLNAALKLTRKKDVILTTFGDMMRVPGSRSSLIQEKAKGADVRMVYSPLDALKIAEENPDKKVVFLSIGFETTTPVCALAVTNAKKRGLKNFSILSANKTMPEALKLLAVDKDIGVNGYLYPGHVSAILGTSLYEELAKDYGVSGVVTGFEPLDMLSAIITLARNIQEGKTVLENQYSRVVSKEGNPLALEKTYEVFEAADAVWRGIGEIPDSGLSVRKEYEDYDAWKVFDIKLDTTEEPKGCLCGEVLKGKKTPKDCKLFNKACTPENPVGSCMVSSEGTCAAYYKYGEG